MGLETRYPSQPPWACLSILHRVSISLGRILPFSKETLERDRTRGSLVSKGSARGWGGSVHVLGRILEPFPGFWDEEKEPTRGSSTGSASIGRMGGGRDADPDRERGAIEEEGSREGRGGSGSTFLGRGERTDKGEEKPSDRPNRKAMPSGILSKGDRRGEPIPETEIEPSRPSTAREASEPIPRIPKCDGSVVFDPTKNPVHSPFRIRFPIDGWDASHLSLCFPLFDPMGTSEREGRTAIREDRNGSFPESFRGKWESWGTGFLGIHEIRSSSCNVSRVRRGRQATKNASHARRSTPSELLSSKPMAKGWCL